MKSTDSSSGFLRSDKGDDSAPNPVDAHPGSGASGQVPIGVSEGDFSTPTRRTRTITKPRGLKALDPRSPAAATVDPVDHRVARELPANPPAPEPWARPVGDEKTESSAVDEFLSAPPTPVPEIEATPLPVPVSATAPEVASSEVGPTSDVSPESPAPASPSSPSILDRLAPAAPSPVLPPVVDPPSVVLNASWTAEMRRAAHQAGGTGSQPTPPVADEAELAVPIEEAPLTDAGQAREGASASGSLASEPAAEVVIPVQASAPSVTVPPVLRTEPLGDTIEDPDDAEADAYPSIETSSLSPLALTLAHMAEALHADLGYEPADDIEFLEADPPLLALAPEPTRLNTPPPVPRHAKGPVPGSLAVVAPSATLPEALAERPRRTRRSKPWYEEIFDENYLRTLPFMTAEQTLREVDFIQAALNPVPGARLLDVGCGYGRHAIELVQRGLAVTGLDLSLPLLLRAAEESQRRGLAVDFVHGDMRKMAFERQFDGAYCMLTTFGYFDEESNLNVAEAMGRALKPGARLLLDVVNRDYIVGDLPARIWWEGDGCVVLEEVEFNFNTNRLMTHRSVVFDDGRQLDQEISLRTYCLHDLGKLLRNAGFRVVEVSGSIFTKGRFFGATSRNLLVVAERRAD